MGAYHLTLTHGCSYSGNGVRVTRSAPDFYTNDQELADRLIQTGYFSAVDYVRDNEGEQVESPLRAPASFQEGDAESICPLPYTLRSMTKAGLVDFAKEYGIDIEGLKKKSDILDRIQKALGEAREARDAFREM